MTNITLLEELNKINSFSLELDLGFSLIKFTSGYRKRFFNNSYTEYNINMFYTAEELVLFFNFFDTTLKYGIKSFNANFFGVEEEFTILKTPTYTKVEGDLYNLSLSVLKVENLASQDLLVLNSYLENFIGSLNGVDSSIEANIAASLDSLDLALFYYNFYNIITQDINTYKEKLTPGGL